jgi:hypothetical protein
MDNPIFVIGIVLLMTLALLITMNMHTSDIILEGATILFLVVSLGLGYYWLEHVHGK